MRFLLPAILLLSVVGVALAQMPHVAIEDDVSHGNAISCAGLRAAQVKAGATPLQTAAHAAWLQSLKAAGHDPAMTDKEVADEAARVAALAPAAVAAKAATCESFEIR